ncbi:MAG: DNA-binding protein [Candidatus Margulisbacteria bacterium GWF2_35_9]|nr:MAG: DNA-binding protein [Candidatus Margulisbacteria bacterium GWF2_35_9]
MKELLIPNELIINRIYLIRNTKVMLDKDLAELYQVETRVLNQAVKRNIKRFPDDFMFQLNKSEFNEWKSQIVISNSEKMSLRRIPYAFTENGLAMLSGILNSERAICINIQIMRTFTKLREIIASHKELFEKINKLDQKYDYKLKVVWEVIDQLLAPPTKDTKRIGFIQEEPVT